MVPHVGGSVSGAMKWVNEVTTFTPSSYFSSGPTGLSEGDQQIWEENNFICRPVNHLSFLKNISFMIKKLKNKKHLCFDIYIRTTKNTKCELQCTWWHNNRFSFSLNSIQLCPFGVLHGSNFDMVFSTVPHLPGVAEKLSFSWPHFGMGCLRMVCPEGTLYPWDKRKGGMGRPEKLVFLRNPFSENFSDIFISILHQTT